METHVSTKRDTVLGKRVRAGGGLDAGLQVVHFYISFDSEG
jgi:hypothetical protein